MLPSHPAAHLYGTQRVQPLDISCVAGQEELASGLVVTSQQKLPKAHRAFEVTEHGFDRAFAQRVDGASR
jgi:hypothetical protein